MWIHSSSSLQFLLYQLYSLYQPVKAALLALHWMTVRWPGLSVCVVVFDKTEISVQAALCVHQIEIVKILMRNEEM